MDRYPKPQSIIQKQPLLPLSRKFSTLSVFQNTAATTIIILPSHQYSSMTSTKPLWHRIYPLKASHSLASATSPTSHTFSTKYQSSTTRLRTNSSQSRCLDLGLDLPLQGFHLPRVVQRSKGGCRLLRMGRKGWSI